MSGSEFPSKALLAEHEPESEYPHDSDEYSERDFCISEHYAVNEKHGPPQQRPRKSRPIFVYFLALAGGLLACRYLASAGFFNTGMSCPGMQSPRKPPPMEVFQVYPPVRVGEEYLPEDMAHERHECSVVLMQHVFGWSYGKPFVGMLQFMGWFDYRFRCDTCTVQERNMENKGILEVQTGTYSPECMTTIYYSSMPGSLVFSIFLPGCYAVPKPTVVTYPIAVCSILI